MLCTFCKVEIALQIHKLATIYLFCPSTEVPRLNAGIDVGRTYIRLLIAYTADHYIAISQYRYAAGYDMYYA